MVIEVDQVHPRLDVFARFREGTNAAEEKYERFLVAVRCALQHIVAPLLDLPRLGLVLRMPADPFQDLGVAFAGGELLEQSRRIEPEEVDDVLVEGRVVSKFAIFADKGGAAFVEHARERNVATKAAARAARRTLGEIRCGDLRVFSHLFFVRRFLVASFCAE